MCLVLSWVPGPRAGWASLFSCGLSVWLTWTSSWHGGFKAVAAFQEVSKVTFTTVCWSKLRCSAGVNSQVPVVVALAKP